MWWVAAHPSVTRGLAYQSRARGTSSGDGGGSGYIPEEPLWEVPAARAVAEEAGGALEAITRGGAWRNRDRPHRAAPPIAPPVTDSRKSARYGPA